MLKRNLPVIVAISILLFANACTKKGDTGAAGATGAAGPAGQPGPSGPSYTGAVSGHITLYDQYGSKLFTGLANVTLALQNGKTVTADTSGYYVFDSVTTGVYSILASHLGFGATMVDNFQFINDTLYKDIKLSAKPVFNINTFKAYHNPGSGYDSLVMTVSTDARPRNCIVFVNNTHMVSSIPPGYLLTYTAAIRPGASEVLVKVPASDLNYAGIFYGEMVYYAAYSYVVNDVSVYEDMVTGYNVYNAVGNAVVDSAISP